MLLSLFRFPRGQHTSRNASCRQAENNDNEADANFSGDGHGRGRQVKGMVDVQR